MKQRTRRKARPPGRSPRPAGTRKSRSAAASSTRRTDRRPRRAPTARGRRAAPSRPLTKADLEPFTTDLVWRQPLPRHEPGPPKAIDRVLDILMVGWEWPPAHSGGLGVHSFELTKEMAAMGHRVTFLLPFAGPRTEVPGVRLRTPSDPGEGPYPGAYEISGASGGFGPGEIERYNAWIGSLSAEGYDVVHAHDWFGTVGGLSIARRAGRPFVQTIHSTEYDRSLGHPWADILEREQVGIDGATRVIAVSQHLKDQLVERYHASPGKVRVIYNAVRPSDRLPSIPPGRKIVLYLGRLAAMKGVDTFLRAAARIAPTEPEALFVVAGEGPEFPRLLFLASHLGLTERVLFLGRVTDEERASLLSSASVFVLPSVVEPFGIAALEAMAAGVPTIVSKTSGVAEISNAVFAVDFWDIDEFASRIAELIEYPALRQAMGEGGRESATREGWHERAVQTVAVYLEAMRARP